MTAVTAQRRSFFQVTSTAELLVQTILDYRSQGKFLLHAFVIMPNHFHALITPAPDVSLGKAMQFIKGGFSFRLKSKQDVWMRSFNESQIMSKEKLYELRGLYRGEPGSAGTGNDSGCLPLQFGCVWTFRSDACAFGGLK